jgi:methionine-rich copper-binding protein CopC
MTVPRRALAALLAATVVAALPAAVAAHSELESSSPAAGEVVVGGPTEITGEFSEPVDPGRSSLELRGPDGARIARGGVPEGGPATRMTIAGIPPLAPGRYTVRWTTVTADDDGVERGTFRFSVEAATPAPESPEPTSTATPLPPPGETPTPAPTSAAEPTSAVEPTPAPTPQSDPASAAGPADVLVPLAVLAIVLGGGVAWVVRRRR